MKLPLLVILLVLVAVLTSAELVMYTATVETQGADKATLSRVLEPFSKFLTNSCTSQDVSGYASRKGGTFTALWLSDAGAKCTSVDLQDFLISQGLFQPVSTTPAAASGFSEKSCTTIDDITKYTYIKCSGCPVKGCNSAVSMAALPVVILAIIGALLL